MKDKARIEPDIASQDLDWSAYLKRLWKILELAGKGGGKRVKSFVE